MKQDENPPLTKPTKPKKPSGGRPSLKEAEQLQGRILDAATELFTKHGYGETSIEAIAAHAGIGKLTLYRRFENKDALFQAVALRMADQSRGEMARVADGVGELSEVLIAAGRHMLGVVLSPQSIMFHRILFAEAARLPELCAKLYHNYPSDPDDPIRRMFRRFVDQGVLRIDDAAFLDHQFVQAIIGKPLRDALLGAPPMSPSAQEEHVRKSVDLFLCGVVTPLPGESTTV